MTDPGGAAPEAVEPFYFGEPRLFGCLHPAADTRGAGPDAPTRTGVVFCHPLGHEYVTLHRAARILASRLARSGLPTLRFDYSGTGDSAGGLEEARLQNWVDDADAAADALRSRTGVERICLVGARLGATLALRAAARRADVESLALWDPVVWGRDYLRQLGRDHRRMLRVAHVRTARAESGTVELLGFRLGPDLVADLRSLAADDLDGAPAERVLLLESHRAVAAPLGARLRSAGAEVESVLDPLPDLWRWSEDVTRVELPHGHLRTLSGWVARTAT